MQTKYKIIRNFYRSIKDMESGKILKTFEHDYFVPLSLKEAQIIKSKLATPKLAIDQIIQY